MKKLFFLSLCAAVPVLTMHSCKPKTHATNPTPNNYRILSYTKYSSAEIMLPSPVPTRIIAENFRFFYDKNNRVERIVYTTNDTATRNNNQNIVFTYRGDTILKDYFNLVTNALIRKDTIIERSGFVTTTYTPGIARSREKVTYEYLGQLLTRTQKTTYRTPDQSTYLGTTLTGPVHTYTSVDGDFLKHNYETNLRANFLSNKFDTLKKVYWLYGFSDSILQSNVAYGTWAYTLTNYLPKNVAAITVDNMGRSDTVGFTGFNTPADLFYNESFDFYTDKANRPGDWMHIQSFTAFGSNVYRNKHLVKRIYSVKGSLDVTYSIDAYSKITQVITHAQDEYLNKYQTTYDLQYEIFQ